MSKQKDHYKTIFEVANFPSVLLDMAGVLVLALTTILCKKDVMRCVCSVNTLNDDMIAT